jgi:hypothetical protein
MARSSWKPTGDEWSELPVLGLRRDVRDVDDLEKGGRRDRGGLEGHDARDGDEAADMFEHARGFGSGRDPGSRDYFG